MIVHCTTAHNIQELGLSTLSITKSLPLISDVQDALTAHSNKTKQKTQS